MKRWTWGILLSLLVLIGCGRQAAQKHVATGSSSPAAAETRQPSGSGRESSAQPKQVTVGARSGLNGPQPSPLLARKPSEQGWKLELQQAWPTRRARLGQSRHVDVEDKRYRPGLALLPERRSNPHDPRTLSGEHRRRPEILDQRHGSRGRRRPALVRRSRHGPLRGYGLSGDREVGRFAQKALDLSRGVRTPARVVGPPGPEEARPCRRPHGNWLL